MNTKHEKKDRAAVEMLPENIREAVHIVAVALARKWKISLDSSRQKSSYTPDKEATTP